MRQRSLIILLFIILVIIAAPSSARVLFDEQFNWLDSPNNNGWYSWNNSTFSTYDYYLIHNSSGAGWGIQKYVTAPGECVLSADVKVPDIWWNDYHSAGVSLVNMNGSFDDPGAKDGVHVSVVKTIFNTVYSSVTVCTSYYMLTEVYRTAEVPFPAGDDYFHIKATRAAGSSKLNVSITGPWSISYTTPDIPGLQNMTYAGTHSFFGTSKFDNFKIEDSTPEILCTSSLIQNGSFEQGSANWSIPSGCQVDTNIAHTGSSSLRLYTPGPTQPVTVYQNFTASPGKRYLIRAWMKANSIQGAWFAHASYSVEWAGSAGFNWNDPVNGVLGMAKPTGVRGVCDWTQVIYVTPPAPEKMQQARVGLSIDWNAYGTAWMDDLCVTEVTAQSIIDWQVNPVSIVGTSDSPPFQVQVTNIANGIFPDPVDVSVTLCAPTWNKALTEQRQAYQPGMTLSFSTGSYNEGLWRFSTALKSRVSGRTIMDAEMRNVWKRPPFECFMDPHHAVILTNDGYPSLDIRPYRDGNLTGYINNASNTKMLDIPAKTLQAGTDVRIDFSQTPPLPGKYSVNLTLKSTGKPDYSIQLPFTVAASADAKNGVMIGRDNVLRDKGNAWFPMFMLTNTANESGAYYDGIKELSNRNPDREAEVYKYLAGTPFGVMDWAVPLGGLAETERFANECANRGIRLGLCLRDMYPDNLGGWGGFAKRAQYFPGMTREQIVRQLVQRFKTHPAVAFYYLNDEMGTEYFQYLKEMRRWVKEEDPLHPCVSSHYDFDPIRELSAGTDIICPELYAWKSLDEPLMMAGWADTVVKAAPKSMPMWENLIFIAESYTLPSERFKAGAYIAIAKGAKGLLIDGIYRISSFSNPTSRWNEIVGVANEIQSRASILLQPEAKEKCTTTATEVVIGTVSGPKGTWLLAVNGVRTAKTADVALPANVKAAYLNGTAIPVTNGHIQLSMQPYEVRLIRLR